MRAAWLAALVIAAATPARADEPVPPPAEPPAPEPEPQPQPKPEQPPPAPEAPKVYDGPYLKTPLRPREIVVDVPRQRSRDNVIVLGSLLGASAIVGAVAVWYHLDSRSASNDVSAALFTGHAWTDDDQALVDRASRARGRAAVAYGASGALLAAAITYLVVTDPKSDRMVIRPHHASISPLPGGAVVGGGWAW